MVVGGGISGMEAARIAAMRGHDVTLYESTDKLGGKLSLDRFRILKLMTGGSLTGIEMK